ncbi:Leo1-like protein-domain-containing protein [Naematelia encephala]|uniref:Leo1-like protein-domain-containing protein n=1 Tax=Naematelia encephala TaxID=71784 RepID=A0A1Y2AQG1_9TREE|nr:Leo1-like protein-domain-containing protein [Naematelia encephala]
MSDNGLADDLFGESEGGTPPPVPSPIASSSKSPLPDEGSPTSPVPKVEDGDEDDEEEGKDLFGDDEEEPRAASRGRSSSATPQSERNPLEYEEEDAAVEHTIEETWVNLAVPQWPKMHATDGKVWHLKLPAYVNIDAKPYDSAYYRATLDEEEIDGRTDPIAAKSRMLGVRNTIRWKWGIGPNDEPARESNARMLRWSDGSVSLQLGSDLFDVAASQGATLARPTDTAPETESQRLPLSQSSAPAQPAGASSTTFLCVAAPTERVLVTETAIAGQLSLLPTSMTSKTYMELVKHVGQQHVKHARMKLLDEVSDPSKVNELLLKASGISVPKPKSRASGTRKAKRRNIDYDSASDGGYASNEPRASRATKDRDAGDYDEDDGFVVADTDEEESDGGQSRRKSKKGRKRRGSDESLDEMEEMERKIEAREREKKRARKEKGGSAKKKSREYVSESEGEEEEEDMDMDVESE